MLVPSSFMHLDSPAWSTNGHRSDAFALEPVIQVGFQNQHGLPRFIGSQVTPLDRAVDGVVTAFDQLSRLIYRDRIISNHLHIPDGQPHGSRRVCPRPKLPC